MDRWVLIGGFGEYELNATFAAVSLHAGEPGTTALARRDDSTSMHRIGDGMRTPGVLELTGRIWRDDPAQRDQAITELRAVETAAQASTGVNRINNAGIYKYEALGG